MTPVRHRALVFDARLFAGNTADDALVTGNASRFCHLVCLCMKRRNVKPDSKHRSLPDSTLFRADNRTGQKTFSPFSLDLILTFDFAALSERRSCPGLSPQRFVPVGTLTLLRSWRLLRWGTYPVRTVMQFPRFRFDCKTILAKKIALSRISKRSENAPKNANFHAYGQDRKGQKFEGRTPLCSQNSPFRNGSKTCV